MSYPPDALVKLEGHWMTFRDADQSLLDKMTFGVSYLKPTDERHDGEIVYARVPVSEVQGGGPWPWEGDDESGATWSTPMWRSPHEQ